MTYQQAAEFLGTSECMATAEGQTRIRRESDRCIALYYDSRPILKWIDNGDIIIHPRGSELTTAITTRLRAYSPIDLGYDNEGVGRWALVVPRAWGSTVRGITGGIRLNPSKLTHQQIS